MKEQIQWSNLNVGVIFNKFLLIYIIINEVWQFSIEIGVENVVFEKQSYNWLLTLI